ncbi:MAG: oxidoreductase [Acidobacteria bacterium]|nr:MAG: oxidoreductase [Acidobacteriota bacterium]
MKTRARSTLSRREFVTGVALGGAVGFPNIVRATSRADKLRLAFIGSGGRGAHNLQQFAAEEVVALCDVNENDLTRAAQKAPAAKKFRDYRRLYDELKGSEYDAVVVSTTEHTHAFAVLPPLERKKHVYCEKPLAHNLRETRLVTEAARRAGVVTQMGTQNHANTSFRRIVELVQGGALGPVRECHVWVSRAWGCQTKEEAEKNKDIVWTMERPAQGMTVPAHLDWELWLGPAPARPFHEVYVPGPKWYRWWDFGSGTMPDLGSHWNDLPFWALRLDAPRTVTASGPPPHPELAPASMSLVYEYNARGAMPPVKLMWYQGTAKPEVWKAGRIPQWPNGMLFVGEKATILADYRNYLLLVDDKTLAAFSPFTVPPPTIPDSPGHHAEWVAAIKNGTPTGVPFSYGGPLTEANQLGIVAYRSGKRIEWDPKTMRIASAPDAERFLTREYRKGWELPSRDLLRAGQE